MCGKLAGAGAIAVLHGGRNDGGTDLLAQSLDVRLGQLLAVHQALNPAVQCRDGGWLEVGRGKLGGNAPDILHIRIHVGG